MCVWERVCISIAKREDGLYNVIFQCGEVILEYDTW